ncbi:MAG: NUDIX domain-containing protein, partial [Brockia lithotrophica]|nr:NUDIX domain-containing protein [Brockia lithotrophica]
MEVSAGGIVYRRGARGPEILVIEDRFGRIAYPKGHLEAGETPEQAALREVEEETGIRGTIEGYLG